MSPAQYSMLLRLRQGTISLLQPQRRGAIQTLRSLVSHGWAAPTKSMGVRRITPAGRDALSEEAGRRARALAMSRYEP